MKNFQIAGASITGSKHVNKNLVVNNQDGYHFDVAEDRIVAVVCDGCGSTKHAEIGAQIAARLIVSSLVAGTSWELCWAEVTSKLRYLALCMETPSHPFEKIVDDFFLFTIVGVVIKPDQTLIFSRGDGMYIVNDTKFVINENNTPNYLGYHLSRPRAHSMMVDVIEKMPTEHIEQIVISTDGAQHIDYKPLLKNPIVWENPDYLRRCFQNMQKHDPQTFHDDTTAILLRELK